MKALAPILGFFEVPLWLFAITQIMQNLTDVSCFLAFAGGFSMGNYLGILIEEKLAMGTSLVRIITPKNPEELVRNLTLAEFRVTCMGRKGATLPLQIRLTRVNPQETH